MTEIRFPDRLTVSVAEAARLLSVSRPTMYEILNRADCNADFKVGNRRLVNVVALKEWVERQTREAAG